MAAFVCGQRFHAHPSSLFVHVVPSINDRVQGRAINRHCTLRVTWVVCLIALTLVRVQGQQTKADPRLLADKTEAGSSETVVYCNVSSACQKCTDSKSQDDACKGTGYVEQLQCWPDKAQAPKYQVEFTVQKPLDGDKAPATLSRSCDPKQSATGSSTANGPAADSGGGAASGSATGDNNSGSTSSSSASSSGTSGSQGSAVRRKRHAASSEPRGLSLVHFELIMASVLSVCLPVVYWRKRRTRHL
eukprot:jgi/Chrzof1/3355/Cz12g22040.t1